MSLILDALKKLERDKGAREPNVLVVGSVPWGTRARSRLPLVSAGIAAVVVALVAVALWPRTRVPRPAATPLSTPAASALPSAAAGAPTAAPQPALAAPSASTAPAARRSSVPSAGPATPMAKPPEETESPGDAGTARRALPGSEELRLTAISERDGRPVALINDRLVFEGDGFEGVKVLRIRATEVEVEVRGVKRVLRF